MSRLAIAGLGTAVPEHTMTQGEAAEMARDICDVDERQQRLLNVLYRKSGVEQRRTALPHRIAREWKAEHAMSSPESAYPGPTTAERMAYYEQHAFPLARQAAEQACTAGAIRPESI